MNILRDSSDSSQSRIISANASSRMLVVAGPGTGKTHVSSQRLAHLVSSELLPSEILVLSFSRSAVRTLMRRVGSMISDSGGTVEDLRHLAVRTFDSWAFRLLRASGVQPDRLTSGTYDDNIGRLADLLETTLPEAALASLDRIRHVVIDECQDIVGVRLRLVKALLAQLAPPDDRGAGFTILGDDAQAIYGFSARAQLPSSIVDETCMQYVREKYSGQLEEIQLQKNYRATPEIAASVGALHQLFLQQTDVQERLRTIEEFVAALPIVWTEPLSPEWLSTLHCKSLAILTRTNGEALRVATQLWGKQTSAPGTPVDLHLATRGVPAPAWISVLFGPMTTDTVSRKQFTRIHTHWSEKLGGENSVSVALPNEDHAWRRLVRACGLGDDATSFSIQSLRSRVGWADSFPDDDGTEPSGITISTIHQAKGMEFDAVVLLQREMLDQEEALAAVDDDEISTGADGNPAEEASVLFVAVTRAARHLGTLPHAAIYRPHHIKRFSGNSRQRLLTRSFGWVNVEIGLPSDIANCSFVDTDLHGNAAQVAASQQLLMSKAAALEGHKVVLCKTIVEPTEGNFRAFYNIHLQNENSPGELLGQTSSQLTYDLSDLLRPKFALPSRIFNLRIGSVISIAGPPEIPANVAEPYRTSGLWLGISLTGTGDFKPFISKGSKK